MAGYTTAKGGFRHKFVVVFGSSGLTLLCFLVLPLMQALTKSKEEKLKLIDVDTFLPEPEKEEPQPEPEKPPEPEEKPPELSEELPPLDLNQLELALNPNLGGGWFAGDFGVDLESLTGNTQGGADLFSEMDLDQKPKIAFDVPPVLTPELRRRTPATVILRFEVTADGKVENPTAFRSTDPAFEAAAIQAIRQWRFEPGRRNNEPVRFKMELPFAFKKTR